MIEIEDTKKTVDRVRVLALGDIRLDAPFTGLSPEGAKNRRKESRAAFRSLAAYARETGISYIVIAGNLTENDFLTAETADFLLDVFREYEDITFILAGGDKEPYGSRTLYFSHRFPKNFCVFPDRGLTRFDFDGISFYGYLGAEENPAPSVFEGKQPADDGRFHLLLGYAASPSDALLSVAASFSADAAVLGSGAFTGVRVYRDTPLILSPGAAEGRDFAVTGFGTLVEMEFSRDDSGKCKVSYTSRAYSTRQYLDFTLDVNGASSADDIREKIVDFVKMQGYGEETYLRLTLVGSLPAEMGRPDTTDGLSLYGIRLVDNTLPDLNTEYLRRDMSVRGELYRSLEGGLLAAHEEDRRAVSAAIRLGLAALDNRDPD